MLWRAAAPLVVEIVPSPEAERDLQDIDGYSASQFGEELTRDYMFGFNAVFTRLADHPESGAVYQGVKPAVRCASYRSHKIYYDFDGRRVFIIRILHHAMNAERLLNS